MWRKIIQGPFYKKANRIDGKVVIITGCNTGIGKQTALELAKRGGKIYMACRDPIKCEDARLEIIEKTKNENIFNRTLDLNSLKSVRTFANNFLNEESKLDILINNAGVMATPKTLTKDGFELQFGVNHLGHFLLTNLLLDTLKKSAPSRIVIVSSAIYLFGSINKADLNSEKNYSKVGAYAQSKLANLLFTKELAKRLEGTNITVNCCHPGIVRTELGRHIVAGNFKKYVTDPLSSYFFKTAEAGAQPSIKLALDEDLKQSGGYYFDQFRMPVLSKAKDMEMAKWLWERSEELVGLKSKSVKESVTAMDVSDVDGMTVVELEVTKEEMLPKIVEKIEDVEKSSDMEKKDEEKK
ncbi:RDH13.2 family protein [Megaselia abdita]